MPCKTFAMARKAAEETGTERKGIYAVQNVCHGAEGSGKNKYWPEGDAFHAKLNIRIMEEQNRQFSHYNADWQTTWKEIGILAADSHFLRRI